MFKLGYPDLDGHRLLHLQVLDKLFSADANKSPKEFIDFLVQWFSIHAVKEDRRIGEFVGDPSQSWDVAAVGSGDQALIAARATKTGDKIPPKRSFRRFPRQMIA